MSEALALPATTLVLKLLIEKRLKIAYAPLPSPTVSVEPPPPRAPPAGGAAAPAEPPGLFLFMHHVTPNAAWRNMFEPHVDALGRRVAPAPVALDLHYLLAAQGADLEREALLGVGVSALTRNAVLPRKMIADLLGSLQPPGAPQRIVDRLPDAPLATKPPQFESIALAQSPLDLDASTKLWSALHSPLRPCAHFVVTTVFLAVEEDLPEPATVASVRLTARPTTGPASGAGPPETAEIDAGGGPP